MKPNISEFSYGYALTDELVHASGTTITGAPVFPSLYSEGQVGGGWDVRIDRLGVPLLLELEAKGHEVYYSAPAFHEPDELNDAYLNQLVKARSIWVKPSQIGPLPDNQDHHISFRLGGAWFFYSRDPKPLEGPTDFDSFVNRLRAAYDQRGATALSEQSLEKLADDIAQTAEKRPDISSREKISARERLSNAPPLNRAAYYASVFLESQLFITWPGNVLPNPAI